MLKDIDHFCKKNDITYYLAFGTLLGAVRHSGFIPWDDDLDVMFTKDQYEKFARMYYSDRYKFVDIDNCAEHYQPMGRVVDTKTYQVRGRFKCYGARVDCYIICGSPNDVKEREILQNKYYALREKRRKCIIWWSRLVNNRLWPWKSVESKFIKGIVREELNCFYKYNYDESTHCYIYSHPYKVRFFEKELFEGKTYLKFEDREFPVPQKYRDLLSIWYGDYMKLPPLEKRKAYHDQNNMWLNE